MSYSFPEMNHIPTAPATDVRHIAAMLKILSKLDLRSVIHAPAIPSIRFEADGIYRDGIKVQ